MDLATMIAAVRRDLKDETSPYRWSDEELGGHIEHAVGEFSEAIPLPARATLATNPGSREIDLSSLSDRIMVEAVEYPVGNFPPSYQRFALWGDTLTIYGDEIPDGRSCQLYYGMRHTIDETTSTIPVRHEGLIAIGAGGYAAMEWASFSIDRVNEGDPGTSAEFLTWARDRLTYFRAELKRLGRRNQVRVSALYRPHYAPPSKATDSGP